MLHTAPPPPAATERARPRWVVPFAAVLALLGGPGSAFVVAEPAGAATTFFVSASGSDTNPCTSTAPCATISHALGVGGSGTTIEVSGTVDDQVVLQGGVTGTVEQWPGQAAAVVHALGGGGSVFVVFFGNNLTLDRLTITGGVAAQGGGINSGGTLTITDSTVTGNTASIPSVSGQGGGIWNGGTATITDSTITANSAVVQSVNESSGGGIFNQGALTITDSTITDNSVTGVPAAGGGIAGAGTVGATIVAANTTNGTTNNCSTPLTSAGYNLTNDTTGTACGFTQATDKVTVSPDLGPLANNGGQTQTLLPAVTSPAVGVIPSPTTLNGVPVCGPGAFDQRGVPRPSPGPKCTIGAVEAEPGMAPVITSANSTVFTAGTNGSFAITTSDGLPTPITLSVSTGTGQTGLPQGVNFTDNGNGTATLSGVAATPGVDTFTITAASSGVTPPATQNFTLVVQGSLSGGAAMTALPNGTGYWIVHPDGGVFSYGTAPFLGSLPGIGIHVNNIVGITVTPDGKGYWLVGYDGGVFTFGDAGFFGSMGGKPLNQPVVAMAATPDGGGYFLVAGDGGVFTFGDAPFAGSMGDKHLNAPVVAMAADPAGGYWLVASDGGLFTFGGAPFMGSMGGTRLVEPMVGVTSAPGGSGYWMVASDGGVFTFGRARFVGSLGGNGGVPYRAIIGLFSTNGGESYTLVEANGTAHPF
jgi:hypothetical protein